MLRITVELIPHGDESRKKTIGVMEIANDGTRSRDIGHYSGILHAEYTPPAGRKGRVTNFARRTQSVWSLVGAFLKLWGHAKHPEKHFQKDFQQNSAKSFGDVQQHSNALDNVQQHSTAPLV